jgi:hypothetical protein
VKTVRVGANFEGGRKPITQFERKDEGVSNKHLNKNGGPIPKGNGIYTYQRYISKNQQRNLKKILLDDDKTRSE